MTSLTLRRREGRFCILYFIEIPTRYPKTKKKGGVDETEKFLVYHIFLKINKIYGPLSTPRVYPQTGRVKPLGRTPFTPSYRPTSFTVSTRLPTTLSIRLHLTRTTNDKILTCYLTFVESKRGAVSRLPKVRSRTMSLTTRRFVPGSGLSRETPTRQSHQS